MRAAGAVLAAGAATFGTTDGARRHRRAGRPARPSSRSRTSTQTAPAASTTSPRPRATVTSSSSRRASRARSSSPTTSTSTPASRSRAPAPGVITVSGDTGNNGSANVQIFKIDGADPRIDVVISGLTLTKGTADEGGAIQVDDAATVTIRDSVLTANHADSGGGAIEASDDDETDVINLVIANSTISGTPRDVWGGGLYFYSAGGSFTITNCDVLRERGRPGRRRRVDRHERFHLDLRHARINRERGFRGRRRRLLHLQRGRSRSPASTITGNTSDDNGGGLYLLENPSVTIDSSTISGNTADGEGGGLYITELEGDLNITNTTISGNTARLGRRHLCGRPRRRQRQHCRQRRSRATTRSTATAAASTSGRRQPYHDRLHHDRGQRRHELRRRDRVVLERRHAPDPQLDDLGQHRWRPGRRDLRRGSTTTALVEIFNSTISGNTAGDEGGGIAFVGSYYGLDDRRSRRSRATPARPSAVSPSTASKKAMPQRAAGTPRATTPSRRTARRRRRPQRDRHPANGAEGPRAAPTAT